MKEHEVRLRSLHKDVYWNPDDGVINTLRDNDNVVDVESMDPTQLKHLVQELDRRFIQLWDKVKYEREQKERKENH